MLSTETDRAPLPALKLHLKAKSARSRSPRWCCAFQSICSLACGRPANTTTASPAPHVSFPIPQLRPGMRSSCALPCPGQPGVWLQMNVVGWCVNIAVCSAGECLQAARTALLVYPPSPSKSSFCFITADKLVCDRRQSHQPEAKAGSSPKCIVWGQLGFFPDKPVPLAAVQCTLLSKCNHNPLCSRRCYPHRKH